MAISKIAQSNLWWKMDRKLQQKNFQPFATRLGIIGMLEEIVVVLSRV